MADDIKGAINLVGGNLQFDADLRDSLTLAGEFVATAIQQNMAAKTGEWEHQFWEVVRDVKKSGGHIGLGGNLKNGLDKLKGMITETILQEAESVTVSCGNDIAAELNDRSPVYVLDDSQEAALTDLLTDNIAKKFSIG